MINASFTSMHRISMKDCDHRSQPDVWGNNDTGLNPYYIMGDLNHARPAYEIIRNIKSKHALKSSHGETARTG